MKTILGIDLGTSSVKAMLLNVDAGVVGVRAKEYEVDIPHPGFAEQNPERWWDSLVEVLGWLREHHRDAFDSVCAVGYSGQMHGLVLTGTDGRPVRPAIIWLDQRAGSQLEQISAVLSEEEMGRVFCNRVSSGFAFPSLLWVRDREPEIFARAAHVLSPKDYIRYKKSSGSREVQKYFDELISKGAKLTEPDVWKLYCKCITGYQNPYVKEVSDNYSQFTELFGKKEVDTKLMEATSYAPVQFIKELCDFEGKDFNIKMRVMTDLFNQKKYDEAFAEVERLKADPSIDQHKFVKLLAFYVRVSPEYTDKELPYETLVNKVRGLRYVAYNMYDRDDAMPHFYYVQGLEYLLKRALEEGKQIPADLVATPEYGKKVYDMRHPDLKVKPKRR